MPMLSGKANVSQYRVSGAPPARDAVFGWAAKALGKWRFESISETDDEASIGWVVATSPDSSTFGDAGEFVHGDYLYFALRFDQRKIPPALLKSEVLKAEQTYLRDHPGEKLNKGLREVIHDSVRKKLMKRCFPTMTVTEALWNLQTGVLTLGTQSSTAIERFVDLFDKSFKDHRANPVSPYDRAMAIVPPDLVDRLERANKSSEQSYPALVEANAWLGNGFMMWIFHRTMAEETTFSGISGPFTATINKKIVLVGEGPEDLQTVMLKGTQEEFSELRTALQAGKVITEATILLEQGEVAWEVTVKGQTFHLAVKSPKLKKEKKDPANETLADGGFVVAAGGCLEEGIGLLDDVYRAFLELRLSSSWDGIRAGIKRTIEG